MTDRPDPSGCVFCNPRIRQSVFAESDGFLAIYNIAPILPGHSLVIPKTHHASLMDLSEPELCAFVSFARSVTRLLEQAFGGSGFNWTIQDREPAGQTVPHLHLHIIPRHAGDLPDPGAWYPRLEQSRASRIDEAARPRLTEPEMQRIVAHLRALAGSSATPLPRTDPSGPLFEP